VFILPFVIIYPFAASRYNVIATGDKIEIIKNYVDKAYLISFVGYISLYIGFFHFSFFRKRSVLYFSINGLHKKLSIFTNACIQSRYSMLLLVSLGFVLIALLYINVMSQYGFSVNIRRYILADSSLRPIFNFTISFIPIILTFLLLKFADTKRKLYLITAVLFILLMLLCGVRSAIAYPVLTVYILSLISKKKKASILKMILIGGVFLFIILLLGQLRNGYIDLLSLVKTFGLMIFYGNNFSDLRDFAWILAYWDGVFVTGKTYLAAFISFIPRSFSAFRSDWALSIYTNSLVGFEPTEHAGLRPGIFGEAYLNFGIFGVIIFGYITGYILKFTDYQIKDSVLRGHSNLSKSYSLTTLYSLNSIFLVTSGFWKFYIILFIVLLGYIVSEILKKRPL
jgi:oligosaccharide repeat unit polymerase